MRAYSEPDTEVALIHLRKEGQVFKGERALPLLGKGADRYRLALVYGPPPSVPGAHLPEILPTLSAAQNFQR